MSHWVLQFHQAETIELGQEKKRRNAKSGDINQTNECTKTYYEKTTGCR
jgi:hypothetical protein